MRLRAWLQALVLAGVATLTFSGVAVAQDAAMAAYQAYIAANSNGDQAGMDAALAQLGAECGTLGFGDLNACVDALNQAQAQAPAAATEPASPTPEQLQAQMQQELVGPMGDYQNALNQASNGDYAGAQPVADTAAAQIAQICANYGHGSVAECIGQDLPPLPMPPAGPTPEQLQAQMQQELAGPLGDYQNALNQASNGDYAGAQPVADAAAAQIAQICANYGHGSVAECIGQELPPLPQPTTAPTAAETPTPAVGAEAPEGALANEVNQLVPADNGQQIQDDIVATFNAYQAAVAQAQSGDYATAKADGDAAAARILQLCNTAGYATIVECIQIELPTFPPEPAQAATVTTPPTDAPDVGVPQGTPDAANVAALRAAADDYMAQIAAVQQGGDYAQAKANADVQAARVAQICATLGTPDLMSCIGAETLPAFPPPSDPAVATTPSFDDIKAAYDSYMAAYNQAVAGDIAGATPLAAAAEQQLAQACVANGFPTIVECIQIELPVLPLVRAADPLTQAMADISNSVDAALAGDATARQTFMAAKQLVLQTCAERGQALFDCVGVDGFVDLPLAGAVGAGADPNADVGQLTADLQVAAGDLQIVLEAALAGDPQATAAAIDAQRRILSICASLGRPLMACVGVDDLPIPMNAQAVEGGSPVAGEAALRTSLAEEMTTFQTARALAIQGEGDRTAYTAAMESSVRLGDICARLGIEFFACVGPDFNTDLAPQANQGQPPLVPPAGGIDLGPVNAPVTVGADNAGIPAAQTFAATTDKLYNDYMTAYEVAGFEDFAKGKAQADAIVAQLQQICSQNGFATIFECIQKDLPEFVPPQQTTLDDTQLRIQLSTAWDKLNSVVDAAQAGDQAALAVAIAAEDEVRQICAQMGRQLGWCVGRPVLPKLPAPQTAAAPDPAADLEREITASFNDYMAAYNRLAAGDATVWPAANSAMLRLVAACTARNYASVFDCTQIAIPDLPADPLAQAKSDFRQLYGSYAGLVADYRARGEASDAPERAPALLQQLADVCITLQTPDIGACVAVQGYLPMEPLPPARVAAAEPNVDAPLVVNGTPTADIGNAVSDYAVAFDLAGTDYEAAKIAADDAKARLKAACDPLGADAPSLCRIALAPFPDRTAPVGGTPANGSADYEREVTASYNAYMTAYNQVAAGSDEARAAAEAAMGRLAAACTALGYANTRDCTQIDIPALPTTGPTTSSIEQAQVRLQPLVDAYDALIDSFYADGEASGARANLRQAAIALSTACQELGLGGIVDSCMESTGFAPLRVLPAPDQATLTADQRVQMQGLASNAYADYVNAIKEATAGDYAIASAKAETARQTLQDACAKLGATLFDCIAGELPPFPSPAAGGSTNAAGTPPLTDAYKAYVAAKASGDAATVDAAQGPLTGECIIAGYPTFEDCIAVLSAEAVAAANPSDPLAAADAGIRAAVDLYAQGTAKLGAGDASGQADIDAATRTLQQNCAPLGFASNEECVANYGLTLPLQSTGPDAAFPAAPGGATPAAGGPRADISPAQANQAQSDLKMLVDSYKAFVDDFKTYGEANSDARLKIPFTLQQIGDICRVLYAGAASDVAACLAAEGYPPLEQLPPVAAGGTTPTSLAEAYDILRPKLDAYQNSKLSQADAEQAQAAFLAVCQQSGIADYDACYDRAAAENLRSSGVIDALTSARGDHEAAVQALKLSGENDADRARIASALDHLMNLCNAAVLRRPISMASPMSAFDDCLAVVGLAALSPDPLQAGGKAAAIDPKLVARADLADTYSVYRQVQLNIAQSGDSFENLSELANIVRVFRQDCGELGYGTAVNKCLVGEGYAPVEPEDLLEITTPGSRSAIALAQAALGVHVVSYLEAFGLPPGEPTKTARVADMLNRLSSTCGDLGYGDINSCLRGEGYAGLVETTVADVPGVKPTVADPKGIIASAVGDFNFNMRTGANPAFDKEGETARIAALCASAGLGDLTPCLATLGLSMDSSPAALDPRLGLETVPLTVDPTTVSPLLDSNKGNTARPAIAKPATTVFTTAPVGPAPKTDADAQVLLPTLALPSINLEFGTTIKIKPDDFKFTPPKIGTAVPVKAGKPEDKGTSFVFKLGLEFGISNPLSDRNRLFDPMTDTFSLETLGGGRVRETVQRPNGVKVVTVRETDGDIVRRSRFDGKGTEIVLSRGRTGGTPDDDLSWRDPGDDLPPLRLSMPARDYVLDTNDAEKDDVAFFLVQPPVEKVRRIYTIDEVKRSARIRDSVRRLEIGGLTFESGSSTLPEDQIAALEKVADAMLQLLERDPAETFLVEGHTDAVGDQVSNLALSDDRADQIARILTQYYHVPPENLATQGYGERFLKVKTELSERVNRRVTLRRITPLITLAEAK